MNVIVPLAGPDFFLKNENGISKAYSKTESGELCISSCLKSREWYVLDDALTRYLFVLLDCDESKEYISEVLIPNFPGAQFQLLSNKTLGAAWSVLSALPILAENLDKVTIVDLADIGFESSGIVDLIKQAEPDSIIFPTFKNLSPKYSYLKFESGIPVGAVEKQVVSDYASAGVYIYTSGYALLQGIYHNIHENPKGNFNGLHYIAPTATYFGLSKDRKIYAVDVQEAIDYG